MLTSSYPHQQCDGNTPSCAACSSVYGTECVYDPNSDHRRKGVYKKDIDNLKTRNSTLQTLIQAILNYPEHEVPALVREIRTCESLDDVAESIIVKGKTLNDEDEDEEPESPADENGISNGGPQFEKELSGKIGEMRLDNGNVSYVGGTSNLIYLGSSSDDENGAADEYQQQENALTSWTNATTDPELVVHLLNLYFCWHYAYFTCLSKSLFYRDFLLGKPPSNAPKRKQEYCTPLLVNAMLALGCHFTSWPNAREDPLNSATAGDHFFREAKRLILENDEHENPSLPNVQALALMSVREAGCGREARGWVYSGMSFRMGYDLGLNVEAESSKLSDQEKDARRVTVWGCFLFDKYGLTWKRSFTSLTRLGVGQITLVDSLRSHFRVLPLRSSTFSRLRTQISGFHTPILAWARYTLSQGEPGRLRCTYRHCVRSVAIYWHTSTIQIT